MNFLSKLLIITSLFVVFSCSKEAEEELKKCEQNLFDEQRSSRNERDILLHYIETFQEIQKSLDSLGNEKDQLEFITMNAEFKETKQKEIVRRVARLTTTLAKQQLILDQNFSTLSLQQGQIEELQHSLAEKTEELIQYKYDISVLLKENTELIDENEDLGGDLIKAEEEIANLRGQISSTSLSSGLTKEEETRLLELLDNQNRELQRLRTAIERKRCVLVLNRSMSSIHVETDIIQLTCKIREKHILSEHPPTSYRIDDNRIYITDPTEFWKYSNTLFISMDKGNCQLYK